ncbi:hypothetical protein AX15_006508 [Amanita polypyramis BW_CC]|nr:hypothetical protein AX15_006508 [Amanita polypyramis BW_CC]
MAFARVRPPKHVVSTFHPARLRPSDRLDFSDRQSARILLSLDKLSPTRLRYGHYRGKRLNFPSNTLDPESFKDGRDLLSFKSLPWRLSLLALATSRAYAAFREQLLSDGLITQIVLDKWVDARKDTLDSLLKGRDITLYYLSQPFFFPFSSRDIRFFAVTNDEIGHCSLTNPFVDYRLGTPAYGGSGIVQLNPCPGRNTVSLRVLKIVEPVYTLFKDYDSYIHPPAEGVLVQRSLPWQTPVISTRNLITTRMKNVTALPIDLS